MKKVCVFTISIFMISVCALNFPISCYADEYPLEIDVSPNIINIASERVGSIRIFTAFRYTTYVREKAAVFVYFNGSDSVQNIHTTRDSLGNLILKFNLEDLLVLEGDLYADNGNIVQVVISMGNGDEHFGEDLVEFTDKNKK